MRAKLSRHGMVTLVEMLRKSGRFVLWLLFPIGMSLILLALTVVLAREWTWEQIFSFAPYTVAVITVPIIGPALVWLSSHIDRDRTIGAGITVNSEEYFCITDELYRSGVRNVRSYLRNNPEHVREYGALKQDIASRRCFLYGDEPAVQALIFLDDTEPAVTKSVVFSLINERCISDENELRELLLELKSTSTPLMDGAL